MTFYTYYFGLQATIMGRKCRDLGIHPILALVVVMICFGLGMFVVFENSKYASEVSMLLVIHFLTQLSQKDRNDFLSYSCTVNRYNWLRIIENIIVVIPFIVVFLYKGLLLLTLVLVLLAIILSRLRFNQSFHFTIPTPFGKRPYEFIMGFRNTFYVNILAYGLTIIAVSVDNVNLGIFSLLAVVGTSLSYYFKPEHEYFLWMYSCNAKQFLIKKMKTSVLHVSILVLPIVGLLTIFYPDHVHYIILAVIIGYFFLMFIIVLKYSAYPFEIQLLLGILLTISISFPPILLVFIPYFFNKSTQKLKTYLP